MKDAPFQVVKLSWEYPPRIVGGLARHVAELSAALVRLGIPVNVITAHHPDRPSVENDRGIKVYHAPQDRVLPVDFLTLVHQLNFGLVERAIPLLSGLARPTVIHAHDWLASYAATTLAGALRLPMVATIHATEHGRNMGIHTDLQRYIHSAEWALCYQARRVICCSHFMANEVQRTLSVPPDKLRVIPNGINPGRLRSPRDELDRFRRRFVGTDDKLVLFVGRMVREKGVEVLVEAAPRVLGRRADVSFAMVGKDPHPGLVARAHQLAGDRISFLGFVDDQELAQLYAVADVAAFPSLYEPFGIVALEAMAAGTPLVVSDIGGLPEIVEHGVTGIATWANNPDSLAWGILEQLDHPAAARAMAARARRVVRSRFNWRTIAQQTVDVYAELDMRI